MSIKEPDAGRGGSETGDDEGTVGGTGGPAGGGLGDDLQAQGTEVLGDSPEDVLVLLPEGADVPIVETEAVDEASEFDATNTEVVDGTSTVPIEDVPLKDVNPLAEDPPLDVAAEEPAPTENLEELASDMDDEFLAPEEAPAPVARAPRRAPVDHGEESGLPQFSPRVEHRVERGRPRWKAPLAVAALLALAATGYLTFPQWKPYIESYLPGGVVSGAGRKAPPGVPPLASTGHVPGAHQTASPGSTDGGGDTKAVDMVRASKEAFREKFLLSIELGYVGEAADE
jgi:hypothetical protein